MLDTDLNHITLTGVLERDPLVKFTDHGTQQVHFTLKVVEPGPAGQALDPQKGTCDTTR